MTAEERMAWNIVKTGKTGDDLVALIAESLRAEAAVATHAERVGCARTIDVLLEAHAPYADAGGTESQVYHAAVCWHLHQAAAAIRARSEGNDGR